MAIFGRSFESQFGEVYGSTFKIWANKIECVEPENLRNAMNRIVKLGEKNIELGKSAFPPNLLEFMAFCKPAAKHPMHQVYISPPDNSDLRKNGASRLAKLRSQVKA